MVVAKENTSNLDDTKYSFKRKAGRSIVERCPIFSPDGESVLIVVENVVRVHNIQTGDCARILETEENVDELIAVQFPENDKYNLYGCSNKGLLIRWTWENGAVFREVKLNVPNLKQILTFDMIDNNECFISALVSGNSRLYLASCSVKTGQVSCEYKATRIPYKGIICVSLGLCNGDKYAAICNGTKCLFIQNLFQPHIRSQLNNQNQLRITRVAAHPVESSVAITDTIGRVTVYRGYLYDYRELAREVMHWHFLPPLAICYPTEGSYLLTGGMEKVLVKWFVGHLASRAQEKSMIPRLPGMVRHIATNNSHIAVSLSNNCVVIASAAMRVLTTVLECGGVAEARTRGSLVLHRPSAALLLPARTGHLQMLSTATDKLLYNIDITQMNSTPATRINLIPLEMDVMCASVCADGSWLVTSEYRNDGNTYPEERLKFWAFKQKNISPFKLNTVVNLSHGGCQVVSIALNKIGDFCISAGGDQKFRIWKREKCTDTKKVHWKCWTACYYSSGIAQSLSHDILNKFKNFDKYYRPSDEQTYMTEYTDNDIVEKILNTKKYNELVDESMTNTGIKKNDEFDMTGVAISQDGSLVAAWFGNKLTLWDTHLCNLRTTLSHPAMRPKGLQVQFGNDDAAHYLVCTTERCVAVWSLLSLTMKWIAHISPNCLAADPFSNKMAVITTNNDLFVFTPHSSSPVLSRQCLLNPQTGVFKQCTFGVSSGDDVRIYMMRNDCEIYCLEPTHSECGDLEVVSRRNLPASNFSALLAEQQLSEVQASKPASILQLDSNGLGKTAIAQFMSAAPHMMPPVSLLCTSFLEHVSGRKEPEQDLAEEPMDVDEDKSSDEENAETIVQNGTHTSKQVELWTPNYEAVKEKRLKKILKEPVLALKEAEELFGKS